MFLIDKDYMYSPVLHTLLRHVERACLRAPLHVRESSLELSRGILPRRIVVLPPSVKRTPYVMQYFIVSCINGQERNKPALDRVLDDVPAVRVRRVAKVFADELQELHDDLEIVKQPLTGRCNHNICFSVILPPACRGSLAACEVRPKPRRRCRTPG